MLGIILTSPQILFTQAVIMGAAVFMPSHPFDWLYNYGVRIVTQTVPLPESGQRRKLVFAAASLLITLLAVWFYMGYNMVGYIQGGIMALLGGLLVAFNLCVLSELLVKIWGMPVR